MPFRLLLLALLLPGCVAAVPAGTYLAGAATTAAATYLGEATFDYAGRRLAVEQMDCPALRAAYRGLEPARPRLAARWTDWLTTRGMIEDQAEDLDCTLGEPPAATPPTAAAQTAAQPATLQTATPQTATRTVPASPAPPADPRAAPPAAQPPAGPAPGS